MNKNTYISVVVYLHNNEKIVGEYLIRISKFLKENFKLYEIIVVNNNSSDRTVNKIIDLKDTLDNIIIVSLCRMFPINNAMISGLEMSKGDYIFEIENIKNINKFTIIKNMLDSSTKYGYDIIQAFNKKMNYCIKKHSIRLLSRRVLYATSNANQYAYKKRMFQYSGYERANIIYDENTEYIGNVVSNNELNLFIRITKLTYIIPIGFLLASLMLYILGNNKNLMILAKISLIFNFFIMIWLFSYGKKIHEMIHYNKKLYAVREVIRLK